jgi:hypothetical protein
MVKRSCYLSMGLAATLLVTLVGCSQAPDNNSAANPDDSIEQTSDADPVAEDAGEVGAATDEATDEATANETEDYRVVEDLTIPAPGPDPLATVFQLRSYAGEFVGSEQLKVTYPTPDRAVVESVVRGLPDDSVRAIRTRYEFESVAVEGKPLWQMVQATEQNKCQPGRGSEEWTGDLCQ